MMSDQLPAGQVTIADLYREISGMRADVGKALERIAVIDSKNNTAERDHLDHETRIRTLERFKYIMLGGAGLGGAIAGWIAQYVANRGH